MHAGDEAIAVWPDGPHHGVELVQNVWVFMRFLSLNAFPSTRFSWSMCFVQPDIDFHMTRPSQPHVKHYACDVPVTTHSTNVTLYQLAGANIHKMIELNADSIHVSIHQHLLDEWPIPSFSIDTG